MTYDYIIFHKGCFDGFTSFVILNNSHKISKNAVIYPDVPSAKKSPPDIQGKNIIIMDVAYKYDVLKDICGYAKSVTFIDHHVTIRDDILKLQNELHNGSETSKIKIIYDERECGASLTWKFLNDDKKLPLFVRYIKDNDTGTWKMRHTHSFMAGISPYHDTQLTIKNVNNWKKLFNPNIVKK